MKCIVIYESKYGYTKRYASWIAQQLGCELREKKTVKAEEMACFDVIIYGGGLYAGGVSGISLITKNPALISEKNVILFTCGLADPSDPENIEHIRTELKKVIPSKIEKNLTIFHLRGGIDYSRLGFVHKSMMAMLCHMMKKKEIDDLRAEDREMLRTYGKEVDFVDVKTAQPIVDCARQFDCCL